MTRFLLSVHHDDAELAAAQASMSEEDMAAVFAQVDAFSQELRDSASWMFAGGRHPIDAATVVSSVDGTVTMTDGPYVAAKEHLGGFRVVEAPELDSALAIAARASAACMGPVELRPFQDS